MWVLAICTDFFACWAAVGDNIGPARPFSRPFLALRTACGRSYSHGDA